MLINPNIDTFIEKFGWTSENASGFISILSMVNPLGGLVGTFVAKYMVKLSYRGSHRSRKDASELSS
jgi:hypothetical protein